MYAIVEFVDDSSVAVVATNWLSKDSSNRNICFWPPLSKCDKTLKERHAPASDWVTFQVRVLHRYGIFKNNMLLLSCLFLLDFSCSFRSMLLLRLLSVLILERIFTTVVSLL